MYRIKNGIYRFTEQDRNGEDDLKDGKTHEDVFIEAETLGGELLHDIEKEEVEDDGQTGSNGLETESHDEERVHYLV